MLRPVPPAFLVILFFFVSLFVYVKLAGPIPFSVNSITTTKSDTFNVTGEGKATAIPDLASVNAGITANGATVKQVQEQINNTSNKVSEAVKKLGIDSSDIQTANYNINPNYDYTGGSQRINGYNASTNLSIKIKDTQKVNEVIDAASSNGANQVGGVSFEVSDKSKAENEAREKAVASAKKKAADAAKIGGFSLGRLVNYSESNNDINPPRPMLLQAGEAAQKDSNATNIEPGSSEIMISVTLSYEIR
jgi:uncharacterized protein